MVIGVNPDTNVDEWIGGVLCLLLAACLIFGLILNQPPEANGNREVTRITDTFILCIGLTWMQ